jgi:DNA mismatch repair protein MutL
MGFRGEALAAISSVAELSLLSRTEGQAHAFLLDGRSGELRPAARATGTTVEVKELFFSTPARRKFLKTDATELAHCIEAVRRHALARPEVGFAIWHEASWWSSGAPPRRRPAPGRRAGRTSRAAGTKRGGGRTRPAPLRVTGRAGMPDAARSRADQQFAYVNGRYVRDKVLTHAARSAYEDVLHGHRQPVYALYVDIDPARVDVNVHPTKIEVRFRDSREVHQAVRHAVENALAAPRAAAAGRAGRRCRAEPSGHGLGASGTGRRRRLCALVRAAAQAASDCPVFQRHRVPRAAGAVADVAALWQPTPAPAGRRWPLRPDAREPLPAGDWPLGRAIAQLQGIYILAENAQGLVIVDMHAAHERIVYERLKAQMDAARHHQSQPLLIPATFAATRRRWPPPKAMPTRWPCWAWRSRRSRPKTLAVRAVPTTLAQGDAVELARSVLAELAQHDAVHRGAARAKRAAGHHGLPRRGARQPQADAGRDERAAAPDGSHRALRPVQPRPPTWRQLTVRELDALFMRGR